MSFRSGGDAIRRPSSKSTGWIVATILGGLLAWYVFSDTPLRLGDRTLRVYDVRDLVVEIPEYRFGQEEADEDERTREDRVRELAEEVRTHVAPGTWDRDDFINFAEGQRLLIVTSEAKHALVRDFLDQIRASQRVQVTIQARFMTIDDGSSGQLNEALAKLSGDPSGPLFLEDAEVLPLLRASQASRNSVIITAPRMTVHSGQRAYVLVEAKQAYVSNVTTNHAADGSVQYVPIVEQALHGVVLEARATVSADRREVTLYLHPRLTSLLGMDDLHVGVGPDGKNLSIQRPRTWTAEIYKTVTIPEGKTMLIRNILVPPDPPPTGGSRRAEVPEEVLLLVTVNVIDPSLPTPAPATAPAPRATTGPARSSG